MHLCFRSDFCPQHIEQVVSSFVKDMHTVVSVKNSIQKVKQQQQQHKNSGDNVGKTINKYTFY